MQKKVTVAVTGVNATDNPGSGLGVARSLKLDSGLDVRVLGLAYDAMEPGIYVDCVIDKSFLAPYPTVNGKAWIDRLLHIKQSCGLGIFCFGCRGEPSIENAPAFTRYGKSTPRGGRTRKPFFRYVQEIITDMDSLQRVICQGETA